MRLPLSIDVGFLPICIFLALEQQGLCCNVYRVLRSGRLSMVGRHCHGIANLLLAIKLCLGKKQAQMLQDSRDLLEEVSSITDHIELHASE